MYSTSQFFFILSVLKYFPFTFAWEEQNEDVLIFLFFALLIGAIFTYLISRYFTEFHYTVVIFFVGILLAVIFQQIPNSDLFKISVSQWEGFNGDLILFIFLPALLFGDSMALNFHRVKENLLSAILLAGPGALFGALFTAVFVKYILPYNWGWDLSLLFGSITCATDPVAVVALLNTVGASLDLTYVIVGEALLNDGTALVLYTLFYELVSVGGSDSLDPGDVAIYFVKVIIISPLLGLATGLISIIIIGFANMRSKEEDTTIQLAITFCCAYFSFYIAQRVVGVSGVLSCCTAGVMLSRYAVPRYLNAETIESVWSAVEWVGNTLLFFLAGLIIGNLAVVKLQGQDVLYIVVVYLFLVAVRYLLIALLYPALYKVGKGCTTLPAAIFVGWSGLRGAVSIALSLSFYQSTAVGQTKTTLHDADSLIFLVGGIAALTLLINATTSKLILLKLHLLDDDVPDDAATTVIRGGGGEGAAAAGGGMMDDPNQPIIKSNNKENKLMFEYLKKRIRLKIYNLIEKSQNEFLAVFLDLPFLFRHCSILKNSPEANFIPKASSNFEEMFNADNDNGEPYIEAEEEGEEEEEEEDHQDEGRKKNEKVIPDDDVHASSKHIELTRRPPLGRGNTKKNVPYSQQHGLVSVNRENDKARISESLPLTDGKAPAETEMNIQSNKEVSRSAKMLPLLPLQRSRSNTMYEQAIENRINRMASMSKTREEAERQIEHLRQHTGSGDPSSSIPLSSINRLQRPLSIRREEDSYDPVDGQGGGGGGRSGFQQMISQKITKMSSTRQGFPTLNEIFENDHTNASSKFTTRCPSPPLLLPNQHHPRAEEESRGMKGLPLLPLERSRSDTNYETAIEDRLNRISINKSREEAEKGEIDHHLPQHPDSIDPLSNIPPPFPQRLSSIRNSEKSYGLKEHNTSIPPDNTAHPLSIESSTSRTQFPAGKFKPSIPEVLETIAIGNDIDEKEVEEEGKKVTNASLGKDDNKISLPANRVSFRMLHHIVYYNLLITMRKAFLDILRVNYFKQINTGKVPRKSFAAIVLLNSTDISLNQINTANDKLDDLEVLIQSHYYLRKLDQKLQARRKTELERKASVYRAQKHSLQDLSFLLEREDGDDEDAEGGRGDHYDDETMKYSSHLQTTVMILISYIEAHEFAQSRIAFYLGETEGIDTPEEEIVVIESKRLVQRAKDILLIIDETILKYIYSKRILFSILSLQQNLVIEFQNEGVINAKYSELLFHEIDDDIQHLNHLERKKLLTSRYTYDYIMKYIWQYYFEELINWFFLLRDAYFPKISFVSWKRFWSSCFEQCCQPTTTTTTSHSIPTSS